jgi:hypothetical protein
VGLTHPESQWFYIISDSKALSENMSAVTSLLSEGQNIAFAHDSSSNGTDCEVRNQSDPSDAWNILYYVLGCLSSVGSPHTHTEQIVYIYDLQAACQFQKGVNTTTRGRFKEWLTYRTSLPFLAV